MQMFLKIEDEKGTRIVPNTSHPNYNKMWGWTRKEIKDWYKRYGQYWEDQSGALCEDKKFLRWLEKL